ncbi:MAG: hypothetical protein IJ702_04170, partial [Fretibacterium sp.]|nr:hypothetical protein [Fretibacterium sp.]
DYFPTYRIAVGDLNGDGAADEVALVYGGDNDEDIDTYFFECWQISQSGGSLTASRLGSTVASHSYYAHRGSACDITAGDFDGDGKLELAAAYGDEWGGDSKKFTYIAIETFKWNGSDWTHHWDDTNDLAYQISRGDKDDEYRQGGIVMTAADLDGDGRDEIVTLALHGHQDDNQDERAQAFLAVWTCDSGNQPGKKGFWNLSDSSGAIKGLLDSWWLGAPWTWSWNLRLFSIAAGPFTGTLRPNGLACDDIAFSLSGGIPGRSLKNVTHQRVWIVKPALDGSNAFSGFSTAVKVLDVDAVGTVGLAAADFTRESVTLDEPEHYKSEGREDYFGVFQVPPFHVDYIQAPWQDARELTNFSYAGGSVSYSRASSSTGVKDTSYATRAFTEKGTNFSVGLGSAHDWMRPGAGPGAVAKILSAKKIVGYTFNVGYSSSTKDSLEEVASQASSSANAITMNLTSSNKTYDGLMSYETDMHIWRYPVQEPLPAWLVGSLIDSGFLDEDYYDNKPSETAKDDGSIYITYTMCDAPVTVKHDGSSGQNDDYIADHEEGNLFSYPTTIGHMEDFKDRQRALSSRNRLELGSEETITLAFQETDTEKNTSSTTSKHTKTHSVSASASLGGLRKFIEGRASGGGDWTYSNQAGNTESYTKTYSDKESLSVSLATTALPAGVENLGYTTEFQAFTDAAGAVQMGFAVDFNDAAPLWRPNPSGNTDVSVYRKLPDPSLVLPSKFTARNQAANGVVVTTWTATEDEDVATQIRGVTFFDYRTGDYTSSLLQRNGLYRISVPVYNASFVDAEDFDVALYWREEQTQVGVIPEPKLMGTQTMSLKGWRHASSNVNEADRHRGRAEFDVAIPEDFPEGNYEFVVKIDPDGKLAEVHEEWSADVPGGNNTGHYSFAVKGDAGTAAASSGGVRAVPISTASEAQPFSQRAGNFTTSLATAGQSMSLAEFIRYALSEEEPFWVTGMTRYTGSETLENVRIRVWLDTTQDGDDMESRSQIVNHLIPAIFPNTERNFKFLVDPEQIQRARALKKDGKLSIVLTADNADAVMLGETGSGDDSSSSGCDTGAAGLGGLAVLALARALALLRKKSI